MRQREDGFGLSLRIGAENVGLNVAFILEQTVEDVDRLPDAARDEMAEQSHVGVRDVIVADSAVTAVADVALRADVCLAGPVSPAEQGLRGLGGVERVLDLRRYDPSDAPTS